MSWPSTFYTQDFKAQFSALATAISERSTLCGGLGMSLSEQGYKKIDGGALTSLTELAGMDFRGKYWTENMATLAANIKALFDGGLSGNSAEWRTDSTTGHASATLWTWANIITDVGLGSWNNSPSVMYLPDWQRMQGVLNRMCFPRVLVAQLTAAGTSTGDKWVRDAGGTPDGDHWVDFIINGFNQSETYTWPVAYWRMTTFTDPPLALGVKLFNGPNSTALIMRVSGMQGIQISELELQGGAYRDTSTALVSPPDVIVTVNGTPQTIAYDGSFTGKYYTFNSVTPSNIYMEHDPPVSTTVDPFPSAVGIAYYEITSTPNCWAYLNITNYVTDQA